PLRRACQGLVEIQTPFPDVTCHVFEAKEAGSERERSHGRSLRIAIVNLQVSPRKGGARVGEVSETSTTIVIPPRILPAVGPSRGIFPFRFSGQAVIFPVLQPEPLAIFDRLEAAYIHDRMIVTGSIHPLSSVTAVELLVLSIRHRMA